MNKNETKNTIIIIGITISIWLIYALLHPFTPVEIRIVNITDVWLMNSGIMIWGYWDNSTIEECEGLFQSGFMFNDIGFTYEIHFKEYPDPDIRCLKLIKKTKISR